MNIWLLLPTFIGAVTGVIGYLTKRSIEGIDQRIIATNKRIDDFSEKIELSNAKFNETIYELRREFYEYKDKVSGDYVKRVDYLMTTGDIAKKLEKVYDILLELKGRQNG